MDLHTSRHAIALTALAAGALVSACSTPPPATAVVSGIATYRERIALPPDAVFEARLEDVSRADAAAELVASTRVESPGAPPFKFSLTYDPARVDARHRYSISARVLRGDELLFTSDTHTPLPVGPDATPVEIMMVRAGRPPAPAATAKSPVIAGLENTRWQLAQLGDTPVTPAAEQRAPYFLLDPAEHRVSGYAGCNRMMGGYALDGASLSFTQMAGTMMACAEGMDTEQGFHAALAKVAKWRIEGERLELLDAGGKVVAQFDSK